MATGTAGRARAIVAPAILGAVLAIVFVAVSGSATLTPPVAGDWTIEAWETASVESGTTIVIGNVLVNGTLFVNNSILELDATDPAAPPRVELRPGAAVRVNDATVRAGSVLNETFSIECAPGSSLALRGATLLRLGALDRGNVSIVGVYADAATISVDGVVVNESVGGFGLDHGASLTGFNLTMVVAQRAIVAAGGSTVSLRDFNISGSFPGGDYLLVADASAVTLTDGAFSRAATGVFLLSTSAMFTNVSLSNFGDLGVLLLSAELTFTGGSVAPHARAGFEAYESTIHAQTTFANYSYGMILIQSKADVTNSLFQSSNTTPKGSFTGIYAFGGEVVVTDTLFNGSYHLTDIPVRDANGTILRDANGTAYFTPLFVCSSSGFWVVYSTLTISRVGTVCYGDSVHAERSDLVFNDLTMTNGTNGVVLIRGTIDGVRLTASNFTTTNPLAEAVGLTVYEATGQVTDFISTANKIGADFIGSTVRLSGLVATPPGLGARVQSGSPEITASIFTIHNASSVLVSGGSPLITNNTFWVSADRMNGTGVEVSGGSPTIRGNDFHGTYALTFGIFASGGTPYAVANHFYTLERGALFEAGAFTVEGNFFTQCWNGVDARPDATGVIRGNDFRDLRDLGFGTGVNILKSATLVEGNTFYNVNYGVKVFFYNESSENGTRVAGNLFDTVDWYAIEIWNSTRTFLVDNNTIRGSAHGGIELFFSSVAASYNVNYDGDRYGYDLTSSNITITGDRIENVSEAIHANRSAVVLHYTTIARNNLGVFVQEAPLRAYNASFQFNPIAVQVSNDVVNEIVDTIFVGNTLAITAFATAHVEIRDSSFIGTLGPILDNQGSSTGHLLFTHRSELNGGQLKLRGVLESVSPALTLRALKVTFFPMNGSVPGISIRGASLLTVTNVGMSNSSTPFFLEVENSTGSFTQVSMRRVAPASPGGSAGPRFANSDIFVRDFVVNESSSAFTLINTKWNASNMTVRDTSADGIFLANASFVGLSVTILDNGFCGVNASTGSALNVTNFTVRGNRGGGLCLENSRASVWNGDLGNTGTDLNLSGSSDVLIVSTDVLRGWLISGGARLTVAWWLTVRVNYANPGLLPNANVFVVDSKGLSVGGRPGTSGNVSGLPPFTERVVTSSSVDLRAPYTVSAVLGPSSASATVNLDQDRLVQLDLNDTSPPTVAVLAPLDGAGFAAHGVTLRFEGSDAGTGLKDLQYRFGAGALTAVATAPGPVEIARDLVDGVHAFTVIATDFAGNHAETTINFTVDTQAPLITVVAPKPSPFPTRGTNVTVTITVEPDVTAVTIGGVAAPIVLNGASRIVELPEGTNAIVVEATDHVGNRANVTIIVVADRTPPVLSVENAGGGNLTVESFAVIRGRTEPGSLVLIEGYPVATQNGTFEALVFLVEGRNEIEIRSRDALGNENVTKVILTRGTVQPSHVLDTVGLLVGAGLLIAAAGVAYITYGRALAKKPAAPPAPAPPPREGGGLP